VDASVTVLVAILAAFAALNLLVARWCGDGCHGGDPRCDWGID
jgi:hypothetical protein